MSLHVFLVYVWAAVCLLISACSAHATATIPTEAPQPKIKYVPGVGRILSSTPTTVFPQKIHIGQDALWYWFEECMCIAKLDPLSGKETTLFNIGEGKSGPYGNPKDMAVDGPKIWVTDTGQFALAKIDTDSNQVAEQIPLEFTSDTGQVRRVQPFGLATDGTTLWVSDFDGNYIVRFDKDAHKILAVINDIRNPEGIAVTPGAV